MEIKQDVIKEYAREHDIPDLVVGIARKYSSDEDAIVMMEEWRYLFCNRERFDLQTPKFAKINIFKRVSSFFRRIWYRSVKKAKKIWEVI